MEVELNFYENPLAHRCSQCGHIGSDVHEWETYIGGRGKVFRLTCDSMVECSRRQDLLMFGKELGEALQAVKA